MQENNTRSSNSISHLNTITNNKVNKLPGQLDIFVYTIYTIYPILENPFYFIYLFSPECNLVQTCRPPQTMPCFQAVIFQKDLGRQLFIIFQQVCH